jgi:ribosomal-protein-alanine N-acetyltransferase
VIVSRPLSAVAATRADTARLKIFVERARRVHQHLDWQMPAAWLGSRPFYFAMDGNKIAGVLAAPPDPPDTAWLRLLAVAEGVPAGDVMRAVWPGARRDLEDDGARLVAALAVEDWVGPTLAGAGFQQVNEVVVLERRRNARSVGAAPSAVAIRPMRPEELPAVTALDQAAFAPPWQISAQAMRGAMREALHATVALVGQPARLAGFQISTASAGGAHLARLAVAPEFQGQGVGTALVAELTAHFYKRQAARLTVNTQQDNHGSLAVYERFGFAPIGERYGVWQLGL